MRILVTGSCGYVGSSLVPKLRAAGHDVYGIDLKWFYDDKISQQEDARYSDFRVWAYDCVIHLAAISNDPTSSYYPRRSWETGTLATMRLADAAAKTGARFIYASSVSVYGADRGMVTEDMDLRPLSDYNKHKMVAERVLMSYMDRMPVQIIRPATICGLSPRMRLDLTVNMLTVQALRDGKMTVFGGNQWRPSIHIDDMIDLYLFMADHPELSGVWNAGFENYTLRAIANTVQRIVGGEVVITPEVDRRSYQVNSDKLLATGFRPQKTVENAVRELKAAWESGALQDKPQWNNMKWMNHLGVSDD